MDQAGFRDWLCRRLVMDSRDAIIFADRDGAIRLWNAGAEAMFGYRAAEMEGQGLDRIIPEPLGGAHRNFEDAAREVKRALTESLDRLAGIPGKELVRRRYEKYRVMGSFTEGAE